jgi:hypothetical protein
MKRFTNPTLVFGVEDYCWWLAAARERNTFDDDQGILAHFPSNFQSPLYFLSLSTLLPTSSPLRPRSHSPALVLPLPSFTLACSGPSFAAPPARIAFVSKGGPFGRFNRWEPPWCVGCLPSGVCRYPSRETSVMDWLSPHEQSGEVQFAPYLGGGKSIPLLSKHVLCMELVTNSCKTHLGTSHLCFTGAIPFTHLIFNAYN